MPIPKCEKPAPWRAPILGHSAKAKTMETAESAGVARSWQG